jgi:ankyrin repeat protein
VHAANDEALQKASAAGHADVVALLIQHGACLSSSFRRPRRKKPE